MHPAPPCDWTRRLRERSDLTGEEVAEEVVRTLVGATVIAAIEVVLLLRGFSEQLQYLITGLIVLAVIMLHTIGERSR